MVSADALALACGHGMTYLKRGLCVRAETPRVMGDRVVLVFVNAEGWVVVLVSVNADGWVVVLVSVDGDG